MTVLRPTGALRQRFSPKDGYDQIGWGPAAQLVWGPDLGDDKAVLRRLSVR